MIMLRMINHSRRNQEGIKAAACTAKRLLSSSSSIDPKTSSSSSGLLSSSTHIRHYSPTKPVNGLAVIPDVITAVEEKELVDEVEGSLKRRRYMSGHWDNVIETYREVEKLQWTNPSNAQVVQRIGGIITDFLQGKDSHTKDQQIKFLPVHVRHV